MSYKEKQTLLLIIFVSVGLILSYDIVNRPTNKIDTNKIPSVITHNDTTTAK